VLGNPRRKQRLNRFRLRGKTKDNAQWSLYCQARNIEKRANHCFTQQTRCAGQKLPTRHGTSAYCSNQDGIAAH